MIRYSDIRPIADVNKGDIVKLTVNRGAITVTIDMLATEQGFLGDRVMLENIQSGALVDARITGLVLLSANSSFGSDQLKIKVKD